ncbi:MAG: HAD family hydrolase [Anaerolineales bacterium]|jgi:D-glycero-D-manno-heptose 1,7-bisphosphate phosphatase
MYPAIFLDRDGVIIENRSNYVRRWEDVAIFGQALTALAQVKSSPHKIVIVTNQSAVGRGIIPLETVLEINDRLVKIIKQTGGRIDGVYVCPHAPQDLCACRKPKPGLLLQAADELSLDLSRSILIGDALSDILAGQAAGVQQTALVRTGLGVEQAVMAKTKNLKPFPIYATLEEALSELIN